MDYWKLPSEVISTEPQTQGQEANNGANQEKGNPLHHKIHLPETIWKLTLQDIKFTAYFLKKYQQERLTSFLGFDPEDPQTSFPGSTQFRGRLK